MATVTEGAAASLLWTHQQSVPCQYCLALCRL